MRVVVLGTSGSGKSTFARTLATATGARHVELDALHWNPRWVASERGVFFERLEAATATGDWVADGNYAFAREHLWSRATHLVWLDYPRWRVMFRVTWRSIRRALTREPICNGNRESLWLSFCTRDSVILWAWQSYRQRKLELSAAFADPPYPHLAMKRCGTPAEAEVLLRELVAQWVPAPTASTG